MSCSWAASPSQIVAASFIDPVPGPEYMRPELVSGGNVPKFITTSARLRRYELLLKTWTLLEDIDAGVTDARSGGIRRTALPAIWLGAQVDQARAHRPQSDGTLAWRRRISDARRRAGSRHLGRQGRPGVHRGARRPGR